VVLFAGYRSWGPEAGSDAARRARVARLAPAAGAPMVGRSTDVADQERLWAQEKRADVCRRAGVLALRVERLAI